MDNSGATKHTSTCHRQFNWIHPKTIATESDYRRKKIRETLEIKKAKYNTKTKVLNSDEGSLVKTNTWAPLFANINEMYMYKLSATRLVVIKTSTEECFI